ncbi:MAG TPA: chaperone modulator CbpM, partial [Ktedonobacteraceae bacterium]|nr:chaperone modulator CbpM [Ktedonobacteraceae bacterium]
LAIKSRRQQHKEKATMKEKTAMDEQRTVRIFIRQSQPMKYYSAQETANASHLDTQMVQQMYADGLLEGVEIVGEERRYSEEDVVLLRRFYRLQHDLGVNQEGAEIIIRLLKRLELLQRERKDQG